VKGRGRAYPDENKDGASPSFDGMWRVWKKSDPATTGIYDRESVDYIINSEEGKKYFHFFQHMLLGSEEHYYVSLLYNWNRTRSFVQTLSAQSVWNTWELGMWDKSSGFQTHTHFLTVDEWDILKGFSKRGMMFARKFSSKKTPELLDMIDSYILFNKSTDAGSYWPGFYHTDITTYGRTWVNALRSNDTIKKLTAEVRKQYGALPDRRHRAKVSASSFVGAQSPKQAAASSVPGGGTGAGAAGKEVGNAVNSATSGEGADGAGGGGAGGRGGKKRGGRRRKGENAIDRR